MRRLLFFFLLLSQIAVAGPLSDTVLVIDPGHGDRANGAIYADPGAGVGRAWECVFAWDTSMRLKQEAEKLGATVFLTLRDPKLDYYPKPWSADNFPEPGSIEFPYKTLVEIPKPNSEWDVLRSRVATANRVYREHRSEKDIIFLSLHFDSANPDLEGISFYYPSWMKDPPLGKTLESVIRQKGRARKSAGSGQEVSLSKPFRYAILSQSLNPDSYLIELGNIRNPSDLWRMKSPDVRQAYAELMARALVLRERKPRAPRTKKIQVILLLVFALALARTIRRTPKKLKTIDTLHPKSGPC